MSTCDVPGANPDNGDALKVGCWAESPSSDALLFVDSTENGRVIFELFDLTKTPIVEYRDAMSEDDFKQRFTSPKKGGKGNSKVRWIWHDKTAFPWDKVIKHGARDGARLASAADIIAHGDAVSESINRVYDDARSTAERVADDLKLRGSQVASDDLQARAKRSKPREVMRAFASELRSLLDRHFPGV